MDEMTELRRMRAAVPVLEPEELAGSMDLPWRVPECETGSRTRRSRRLNRPLRWRAGTAVALGLAAAVIASVVMVPHVRPRHPQVQGHQQGGQTVALPARQILLAAARRAEAQAVSPASGYWRERTIDGTAWQVGPATNRYVVEERVEYQVWQRRTPQGGFQQTVSVSSLGAHPQTAADVAAWRRDGSPARWVVTFPGSSPDGTTVPMTRELRARPSRPVIKTNSIPCLIAPGEPVPRHGTCVRIEPAYRLPTDPAKLAQALAGGDLARDPEGATGAGLPGHRDDDGQPDRRGAGPGAGGDPRGSDRGAGGALRRDRVPDGREAGLGPLRRQCLALCRSERPGAAGEPGYGRAAPLAGHS